MKAIKLQATIGDVKDFDCTGGEPKDRHWTIAEIDPATDEQVAIAAQIHGLLQSLQLNPSKAVKEILGVDASVQVRLMDGDGRA